MPAECTELKKQLEEINLEWRAASLILNSIRNGERQAVPHLARAWKALTEITNEGWFKEQLVDPQDPLLSLLKPLLPPRRLTSTYHALNDLTEDNPAVLKTNAARELTELLQRISKEVEIAIDYVSLEKREKPPGKHRTTLLSIGIILFFYLLVSLYNGTLNPFLWKAGQIKDMHFLMIRQEYGTMRLNKSVEGGPLKVSGETFSTGIGTHARSEIEVTFPPKYSVFRGGCGLNEVGTDGKGSIVCMILINDSVVFDSGVIHQVDGVVNFSVPVVDANKLRLIVDNAGDGNSYDHADWVNLDLQ